MIEQGQDKLNMLHTLRVYPQLLLYTVLEEVNDFNENPMTPPSIRANTFNPLELRILWGTRALDA